MAAYGHGRAVGLLLRRQCALREVGGHPTVLAGDIRAACDGDYISMGNSLRITGLRLEGGGDMALGDPRPMSAWTTRKSPSWAARPWTR